MRTTSKGAGAAMIDIEVISTSSAPQIQLHGAAKELADSKGIKSFELSISHSEDVAVAVVIAKSE